MAIATNELVVEGKRQKLAVLYDFEPYSAFVRIDRNGDNKIDSGDMFHFLIEIRELSSRKPTVST